MARAATSRFSLVGMAAVATLLATGIVNSWYLVGNVDALLNTHYGKLLLIKLALFLGMVGIAAFNWSHPGRRRWCRPETRPLRKLRGAGYAVTPL